MTRPDRLADSHGRVLRDLRVSLTDRCNFRCLYCLPETEAAHNFYRGRWARLPDPSPIVHQWQPKANLLTFEEIERVVRLMAGLGIKKIRLTGGEPLLRQSVEDLVARVCKNPRHCRPRHDDERFLFPQKARALREAGLHRVSFSLDSLDRENFKKITGRDGFGRGLSGITLAQELGFHPVKVNAVHYPRHQRPRDRIARRIRARARSSISVHRVHAARFWPRLAQGNGCDRLEILERLRARFDLRPVQSGQPVGNSEALGLRDGRGENLASSRR